MKIWYKAVCDEHKEFIDIFVSNPACTNAYLGEFNQDIQNWLTKHYGCDLRLVHRDEDLDKLWDDYTDMSKCFLKDRP